MVVDVGEGCNTLLLVGLYAGVGGGCPISLTRMLLDLYIDISVLYIHYLICTYVYVRVLYIYMYAQIFR